MTDNNKINSKHLHGSNCGYKHSNLSINSNNLSLIANVSSSIIQGMHSVREYAGLNISFSDVTPVITHLFDFSDSEKQGFTSHDNKRYYRDLSKLVSGRASRHLLAFFVPDNSSASQAVTIYSSIAPRAYLSALRGQTIISMASHLPTDYDGLTLQNKIVFGRICGAVSNKTESKTRHPIPLPYSVTLTQNLLGGIHA